MKSLDFAEVAKLINHSRVTTIDLEPFREEKGKWSMFRGINKVPHFEYNFEIVYFYSDTTIDAIRSAAAAIKSPDTTQIVYAPSSGKLIHENITYLKNKHIGLRSTPEYLLDFIKDQMSKYHKTLLSLAPEDFVEPPYETPSGFTNKYPNPLLLMLKDSAKVQPQGELAILLAEPGQGKTYTTLHLASNKQLQKVIPIYVSSPQWSSMSTEDLTSIWKTITNSFKWFESEIDWISGCEEEFIRICMRAGIFAIIFDGFDEYILWNHGKIDPVETLERLFELANASASNILVTSRTSFWDSELAAEPSTVDKLKPSIYKIKPFDRNHARNYFSKRFGENNGKVLTALRIYDALTRSQAGSVSNLAGRGFILYLIADLADSEDFPTEISLDAKSSLINWVIDSLCRREETRQHLPITANQQLILLKEIADHKASGVNVTTTTIRDILTVYFEYLNKEQINSLIGDDKIGNGGSLHDHPLIRKDHNDLWSFFHDQIYFNILAEQLVTKLHEGVPQARNYLSKLRFDGSILFDLSSTLIDSVYISSGQSSFEEDIMSAISTLLQCKVEVAVTLATTISLLVVNKFAPQGRERLERTQVLKKMVNQESFNSLIFTGSISSIDFSDTTFLNCKFDQVTWSNCKFNSKSKFESCTFIGGKVTRCEGFGKSTWIKENTDSEAKHLIETERIIAGEKAYNVDDLRADINVMIKKFVPKEGIGFKTVYEKHLDSGLIGRSNYKVEIIETLKKYILEWHELSGVSGGAYHVRDTAKAAILHYESNGAFTGPLKETFKELKTKLKIS